MARIHSRVGLPVCIAVMLGVLLARAPHAAGASPVDSDARLNRIEIAVVRAEDLRTIRKLQRAYGYYAEKSLWRDIAALFSDSGVMQEEGTRHAGRAAILEALQAQGPEGPVTGRLDSQLQLQPVIEVSPDGRSARLQSRVLQLSRDAQGRATLGAGNYDSELVKEDGVWKFRRLQFHRAWQVEYRNGWSGSSLRDVESSAAR